eukprot:CAMPEP_0195508194 /NCGR_PEP_ID=MMETSP0794_2-20130614/1480_1 /TAXON_ID=515487 /ORGANISM="Stephanopyxis turris, Strain CCMP 815" /LENGTH=121 /DNA_ID=CAMNT_0040635101 /DNA_START=71 /DNA_END=436 /DNA_ORIENTATION=-
MPKHVTGQMSKAECEAIYETLGQELTPGSCSSLIHPEDPFEGKDKTHHRNSWLWPKFARRRTKAGDGFNRAHPTNWQSWAVVDNQQCDAIHTALKEKFGEDEAVKKLPDFCLGQVGLQKMG